MSRLSLIAFAIIAALTVSGCKIVFDDDKDATAIPDGPEGDDARNEARIEETFDAQLLPHIRDNALGIAELQALIAEDIEAAGAEHANQGSGQGAAWNFPVAGEGTVVEARLDTRARSISVDTDGDATVDVTVQLGPVIKGTAMRDAAPFYQFDDFRDQIEFAKLSRALNDRVVGLITVPDSDLIGSRVSFFGVVPLKKADDEIVVTPIDVTFEQ
ncbi:DUF2291 family protein [Algicella marina]|uniref:DUF2291 family protein n=1 Tax=Algicella marina TaxID=2683284 RepID=A0A6P1T3F0_9RHOB|nr:DUF2291 domain-containing protein [Algicella marina]QHQ36291.1 DUF2291 family protein [Algicella marina]